MNKKSPANIQTGPFNKMGGRPGSPRLRSVQASHPIS